MRIKKISQFSDGVTGFFEDVPTLFVVTVAILIFLAAVSSAYKVYTENKRDIEFTNKAYEFAKSVRASEKLTYRNVEGIFDYTKISTVNIRNITEDLQPGFEFRIQIEDRSDYFVKYYLDIATSDWKNVSHIEIIILSCVIWVSEEEIHTARLIVSVWR